MEAVGCSEQGGRDQGNPFLVKRPFDGLAESSHPPRGERRHKKDSDRGEVGRESHGELTYLAEDCAYPRAHPVKEGWFGGYDAVSKGEHPVAVPKDSFYHLSLPCLCAARDGGEANKEHLEKGVERERCEEVLPRKGACRSVHMG